jgi:hypothetical protein
MFRTPVLVLLLVGLAGLSAPPARMAEVPDLAGVYSCDGVNPAGRPYRGIVEIVRMDNTFHLRWTFPQENDAALGIGIISNGVLAVSYYGGAAAGVVVYKIEEDNKLVGDWTIVGADGTVFHETLKRLEKGTMPNDGDHGNSDRRPADREHRTTPPSGRTRSL